MLSAHERAGDIISRLARIPAEDRLRVIRGLTVWQRRELNARWWEWAHDGQRAPPGDWRIWLIRAGRGFGKTRAGAEWVSAFARENRNARIALVGGTIEDVRRVMIDGEAGLFAVMLDGERVKWRPSEGEFVFDSGARAFIYSAETPEKLRGPEHHLAWCDELAKWRRGGDATWDNLMLTMRLGDAPRVADAPLAAPAEGWVALSEMACTGAGSVLAIGDMIVPEHALGIASGYDDSYNVTPARLLRNALHLGYRGSIVHYVGMSHYFRLEANGAGLYASLAGGALNVACAAWHRDFAARAKALDFEIIWSLSYELFDAHCWEEWKQRAADGGPALTGWVPPSTLLSPAHEGAMGYLRQIAQAFMTIATGAGLAPKFQAGEPWWWVTADGRPCLYDSSAKAALGGDPVGIADVRGALNGKQTALLDAAGALLAQSTAALIGAVKAVAPGVQTHLLTYLPSVLAADAPEIRRANLPLGWASPAFDVLQLEDYDWVIAGDTGATARGVAEAGGRLGYPVDQQHYLSGFVLRPEENAIWGETDRAAAVAQARGVARTFVWALPQVIRDGFLHFDERADDMDAFDDVLFPLALGKDAEVTPGFSTAIVTSAGGHEARNASWEQARTNYDVGPGVRSDTDIAVLLAFFRARMGPARGFRLRDPFDSASGAGTPLDQRLGIGDGITTRFALVKHYGDSARRITRPVAGSVRVAVDTAESNGFTVEPGGWIVFDTAPPAGATVSAGFAFDVPVRFAEDRLSVNRSTFLAGAAPSVPLTEVRED